MDEDKPRNSIDNSSRSRSASWEEAKGKLNEKVEFVKVQWDKTKKEVDHELDLVKLRAAQKAALAIDSATKKVDSAKILYTEVQHKAEDLFKNSGKGSGGSKPGSSL